MERWRDGRRNVQGWKWVKMVVVGSKLFSKREKSIIKKKYCAGDPNWSPPWLRRWSCGANKAISWSPEVGHCHQPGGTEEPLPLTNYCLALHSFCEACLYNYEAGERGRWGWHWDGGEARRTRPPSKVLFRKFFRRCKLWLLGRTVQPWRRALSSSASRPWSSPSLLELSLLSSSALSQVFIRSPFSWFCSHHHNDQHPHHNFTRKKVEENLFKVQWMQTTPIWKRNQ